MFVHGSGSLQLFPLVWIFLTSLGVICYNRWVLSKGHKDYFKDRCLMSSQQIFLFLTNLNLIMAILSKACRPDNFELHNSLKLSFTNIWGLRLNFVDCESFLESNSPDVLALCNTNLDDLHKLFAASLWYKYFPQLIFKTENIGRLTFLLPFSRWRFMKNLPKTKDFKLL